MHRGRLSQQLLCNLAQSTCINPNNDPSGPWCAYEIGSCSSQTTAPFNSQVDYCEPHYTLSGCKCSGAYTYSGRTYYGDCVNDASDPRGSWCVVDPTTCPDSYRAHAMIGEC